MGGNYAEGGAVKENRLAQERRLETFGISKPAAGGVKRKPTPTKSVPPATAKKSAKPKSDKLLKIAKSINRENSRSASTGGPARAKNYAEGGAVKKKKTGLVKKIGNALRGGKKVEWDGTKGDLKAAAVTADKAGKKRFKHGDKSYRVAKSGTYGKAAPAKKSGGSTTKSSKGMSSSVKPVARPKKANPGLTANKLANAGHGADKGMTANKIARSGKTAPKLASASKTVTGRGKPSHMANNSTPAKRMGRTKPGTKEAVTSATRKREAAKAMLRAAKTAARSPSTNSKRSKSTQARNKEKYPQGVGYVDGGKKPVKAAGAAYTYGRKN
tara:strand:+ start:14274 stop:15257 length:984 start_codon:yes stop_codon:yes gene_type:complete